MLTEPSFGTRQDCDVTAFWWEQMIGSPVKTSRTRKWNMVQLASCRALHWDMVV